jgi:pyruvate dehydrogenase E2 component (dihydrolipoamide acetyltransferase)
MRARGRCASSLLHVTAPIDDARRLDTRVTGSLGSKAVSNRLITSLPHEPPERAGELLELSRIGRTVARRMVAAHTTIPDFCVEQDADMEAATAFRERHSRSFSHNDLVIAACANALRRNPHANASWTGESVQLHERVNVGVAIAGERSLVVATIFDADRRSLAEIAQETRGLATRVREGTIAAAELAGQTFTVSNLGMHGVRRFTAVVNPPQAAVLAVGEIEPRAVAWQGQPAVRRRVTLTLSCDHRVVYGAEAAALLRDIRWGLEHPDALTREAA